VIVTGPTTGRPVDGERLRLASQAARHLRVSLYIGSGSRPDTLPDLMTFADGIIVGSAIRKAGKAGAPLDLARARAFVTAFKKLKKSNGRIKRSTKKAR
jgi:predicted TIM-barrel enzyme